MTVGESLQLGRYTVRCTLRFDNPFWPKHLIFVGDRLIGAQFSVPCESDCQWLERAHGRYSDPTPWRKDKLRGVVRSGRLRREEADRQLAEAMES